MILLLPAPAGHAQLAMLPIPPYHCCGFSSLPPTKQDQGFSPPTAAAGSQQSFRVFAQARLNMQSYEAASHRNVSLRFASVIAGQPTLYTGLSPCPPLSLSPCILCGQFVHAMPQRELWSNTIYYALLQIRLTYVHIDRQSCLIIDNNIQAYIHILYIYKQAGSCYYRISYTTIA